MEVEFVEEVGLTAAAPQAIAVPPPPSQAPEIGEAEPVEAPPVIQPDAAARAIAGRQADAAEAAYRRPSPRRACRGSATIS